MSGRLLFISDLHLQVARPDLTAALLDFLGKAEGQCSALYILGDLFEVWLGDDVPDPLAAQVAAGLSALAKSGTAVYLMHGNRDFLLGEGFARSAGATLLADPTVIDTAVGPVLLTHGDHLCTDDVDYQQFRTMVRNPEWQSAFLAKSIAERIEFAKQARAQSKEATATKEMAIMDVNSRAVEEFLLAEKQTQLLHGHTHRPGRHPLDVAGKTGWRLVLGDWDKTGWFAEITEAGATLQQFAIESAQAD